MEFFAKFALLERESNLGGFCNKYLKIIEPIELDFSSGLNKLFQIKK